MKNHPFTLEPYKGMKSRYRCPQCHKERVFTRYIHSLSGDHIHPDVGRCNRENNCGYHYTPKQYFADNPIDQDPASYQSAGHQTSSLPEKSTTYIPGKILKASLKKHEDNHFIQFLISLFGNQITSKLIGQYFIGTSKHWEGSTVFWQIDISGRIRSGKVMLYDPVSGKRVKEPFSHITWVHKLLKQEQFVLKQCLYGEHLLKDKSKPVAIVESEKTAIIASVYLPQFTWLAAGSLNNLNTENCEVLSGRHVILFPDLNGFDKWTAKADELSDIATFIVSDLLERKATDDEKVKGLDLADYLIRYDHRDFQSQEPEAVPEAMLPFTDPFIETCGEYDRFITLEIKGKGQSYEKLPEPWDEHILELETKLKHVAILDYPIQLNQYSIITDHSLFIRSHFEIVRANNGNKTYLPYLRRLQEFVSVLSKSLH